MKISQREARRLRKRVTELERVLASQNSRWSREWPSAHNIANCAGEVSTVARIETARILGHAVVVVTDGQTLKFFAEKL